MARAEACAVVGALASQYEDALASEALLRWHPDKWAGAIAKVAAEELAPFGERLREITQKVVELKDAVV